MKLSRRTILFACFGALAVTVAALVVWGNRWGFAVKDPAYQFVGCTVVRSSPYVIGTPSMARLNGWLWKRWRRVISPDYVNTDRTPISDSTVTYIHLRFIRQHQYDPRKPLWLRGEVVLPNGVLPAKTLSDSAAPRFQGWDTKFAVLGTQNVAGATLRLYDRDDGHLVGTCRLK